MNGQSLFREIHKNHHRHSTENCAAMAQAEAMAHVAAAIQSQNELLEERNEILEEIETNTRPR